VRESDAPGAHVASRGTRVAAGAGAPLLTVYSKPDCHLCEDAIRELRRLQAELGFALEERDILQDDALHRAYFERIPVVALDGEELCDYFVDEALLRERLAELSVVRLAERQTEPLAVEPVERPTEQPAGARDAGRPR
jgi:glutaredoxin